MPMGGKHLREGKETHDLTQGEDGPLLDIFTPMWDVNSEDSVFRKCVLEDGDVVGILKGQVLSQDKQRIDSLFVLSVIQH